MVLGGTMPTKRPSPRSVSQISRQLRPMMRQFGSRPRLRPAALSTNCPPLHVAGNLREELFGCFWGTTSIPVTNACMCWPVRTASLRGTGSKTIKTKLKHKKSQEREALRQSSLALLFFLSFLPQPFTATRTGGARGRRAGPTGSVPPRFA